MVAAGVYSDCLQRNVIFINVSSRIDDCRNSVQRRTVLDVLVDMLEHVDEFINRVVSYSLPAEY